jgi:preprotein translocase subunit Sec63
MSFKENFQKEEKESLDYDDSAFYYFSLAMLVVTTLPLTYILVLKPILYGEMSINHNLKNCKCSHCEDRMKNRANKYRFSWLNTGFAFKLLFVAFMWFLTYKCFDIVKDVEPLKTFIPNEILGVSAEATVAEVKKAYRKLSREKHPDKNPDNPEAVNEFIQITKAYTVSIRLFALTYKFTDHDRRKSKRKFLEVW